MTSSQQGFLLLLAFGLILIAVGYQGNVGVLLAILMSPSHVELNEE